MNKLLLMSVMTMSISACFGGEEADLMPVVDTSNTLSGIDADSDGVRDDVQFYIDNLPESDSNKANLTNYAKSLQLAMAVDPSNTDAVRVVVDKMLFNVACLVLMHSDTQQANKYVGQMTELTRNTEERHEQGERLDEAYSGSVYRLPEVEECE